jgi:hypothetical protein
MFALNRQKPSAFFINRLHRYFFYQTELDKQWTKKIFDLSPKAGCATFF